MDPQHQERFEKVSGLDKTQFLARLQERSQIADEAVKAVSSVFRRAVQEDRLEEWEYPAIEQTIGQLSAVALLGTYGVTQPVIAGASTR